MRVLMVVLAFAMATTASGAPAARTVGPVLDLPLEGVVTNPDWKARPSGDQINAAYPKIAQLLRLSGRADMICTSEVNGAVDDCRILSETPVGLGFGAAALSLAPFFQMRPETIDGRPVGGAKINIPLRFKMLASEEPPALPAATDVDPAKLSLAREIVVLQKSDETLRHQFHAWLDGMVTTAVQSGETRPSIEVIDAMQAGLDDITSQMIDREARRYAGQATADQLRSIRDFLQSSPGQTLINAQLSNENSADSHALVARLPWMVRDKVCARIACLPAAN